MMPFVLYYMASHEIHANFVRILYDIVQNLHKPVKSVLFFLQILSQNQCLDDWNGANLICATLQPNGTKAIGMQTTVVCE